MAVCPGIGFAVIWHRFGTVLAPLWHRLVTVLAPLWQR